MRVPCLHVCVLVHEMLTHTAFDPLPAVLLLAAAGSAYVPAGALIWGPLCGAAHKAGDWLQPQRLMLDVLVNNGLLDPAPAELAAVGAAAAAEGMPGSSDLPGASERAAAMAAASLSSSSSSSASASGGANLEQPALAVKREEDLTHREKLLMVRELKERELAELKVRLESEAAERARQRQEKRQGEQQPAQQQHVAARGGGGSAERAPAAPWYRRWAGMALLGCVHRRCRDCIAVRAARLAPCALELCAPHVTCATSLPLQAAVLEGKLTGQKRAGMRHIHFIAGATLIMALSCCPALKMWHVTFWMPELPPALNPRAGLVPVGHMCCNRPSPAISTKRLAPQRKRHTAIDAKTRRLGLCSKARHHGAGTGCERCRDGASHGPTAHASR